MTKEELVKLLESLGVPISDSTPTDDDMEEEIRIHYWDYIWEDLTASGKEYTCKVTYQISVVADRPRHPILLKLKKELNKKGLHPDIRHEYIPGTRRVHSFFPLEVLENIGGTNESKKT